MRRLAGMTVAALLLLSLLALPALAWHAEGYGDCDGWHVTNPEADWNSPDLEMGVFPVGTLVPYGETMLIANFNPPRTERTFYVAWRKIGDGDNWKESRELTLRRDLDECGDPTTSSTSPPTTEAPPSTDTTTTSTTTPGTSSSTTIETSTTSTSTTSTTTTSTTGVPPTTTPPAPSTTVPGGTSTPETLPFTGPFEDTGLLVVLAVVLIMGGVGLWLLTDDKDDL